MRKGLKKLFGFVLMASIIFGGLSGGVFAANDTGVTDAVNAISSLMPLIITLMILMIIFSFLGGFFSGMNKAIQKMQI